MHVVCVLPPPEHAPVEAAQLAVYADGWTEGAPQASRPPPSHSFLLPPGVASVEALALHVMRRLGVAARGPTHQPPGIYLPSGARLSSVAEVRMGPFHRSHRSHEGAPLRPRARAHMYVCVMCRCSRRRAC